MSVGELENISGLPKDNCTIVVSAKLFSLKFESHEYFDFDMKLIEFINSIVIHWF